MPHPSFEENSNGQAARSRIVMSGASDLLSAEAAGAVEALWSEAASVVVFSSAAKVQRDLRDPKAASAQ